MSVSADIKRLLVNQKPIAKVWTDEERKVLLEFKNGGVGWATIAGDKDIMKKYFPARTSKSIKTKYYEIN